MRATVKTLVHLLALAAVLAAAGCAGMEEASHYDGATPGTVPGHYGEPSGPMSNGLLPEPWGSTS